MEFSRVINSSLDLTFILNNILFTCMGKFLAVKGLIALKANDNFELKSFKGISQELLAKFPDINSNEDFLDNDLLKSFMNKSRMLIVERIRSSDECLGFICLGEKLNQSPYSEMTGNS